MVIRLLSVQVPKFWEIIKYAIAQVEKIGDDESLGIYNRLFAALLADKAQCFIAYNSDESVKAVCITEYRVDLFTNIKTLHIRCLYAFSPASNEEWHSKFEHITKLAKDGNCQSITFDTSNPRIRAIVKDLGAVEVSTRLKIGV